MNSTSTLQVLCNTFSDGGSRLTPHASLLAPGSRLLRFPILFPLAHAPEEEPEENRAASVYSRRVTQLIGQSRIIRRVDAHVLSHQQIRHGHRHQRALNDPSSKTRRPGTL